ncbi:MAG: hypothetical protein ACE366_16285 [Bradymonadia bacterium]
MNTLKTCWMRRRTLTALMLAMGALMGGGCDSAEDETVEGPALPFEHAEDGVEPDYTGKNDDAIPLTLVTSKPEINVYARLDADRMGNLSRGKTAMFNLDGMKLSDHTVLIIDGDLHTYEGDVETHRLVVKPEHISAKEGAANPDGFFIVDLKDEDNIQVIKADGAPFGSNPGVFRGRIIATEAIAPGDVVSESLYDYYLEPAAFGQRAPNVLSFPGRNRSFNIRPAMGLTMLSPTGNCLGSDLVQTTLAGEKLNIEAGFQGFPAGRKITVEARLLMPHYTAESTLGQLWNYAEGLFGDEADVVVFREQVTPNENGEVRISFDKFTVRHPGFGEDYYTLSIDVLAYSADGNVQPSAQSPAHHLVVVRPDTLVPVDAFELCPPGDDECKDLRDRYASEDVLARRQIVEWKAERDGLYDTITRPLGRCAGGDQVAGEFTESCTYYHESSDMELAASVEAELNFELSVNGQASGEGSWGGSIDGLATGSIEGAFKAAFSLEADLKGKFKTSRVWKNRRSLDVLYDPSSTQIQWWRVVTPRVRYLELAQFDACGARHAEYKMYLSDLRDSRLVLACEEVPSFDSVCHAVEPTAERVQACNTLLLDPESAEGQACLGE